MPELPEVEILVRHLAPLLKRKSIRTVRVHRAKVIAPTTTRKLQQALTGAKFIGFETGGHTWVGHDAEVMQAIVDLLIPKALPAKS